MKSNSRLRREARMYLRGKWADAALFTLLFFIIASVVGIPQTAGEALAKMSPTTSLGFITIGSAIEILLIPVAWCFVITFLDVRKGENIEFEKLFRFSGNYGRVLTTIFLEGIYILLWLLCFVIPGIIKSLSYALTPYILRDHPELSNNAAIELSMDMMRGNKFRLFLLSLSFVGWGILVLLTCGIGFFWFIPYVYTAVAGFYEDVKTDYEGRLNAAEASVDAEHYVKEES